MSAFDNYGKYYDLLNDAKDYDLEADYVLRLIHDILPSAQRVLELGCGTGGHAFPLVERGCSVQGIDLSPEMIERAVARKQSLASEQSARVEFSTADLRDYRADQVFDAVISLFHVISYQPSNADLQHAFETARTHLQPGGVFVFDCWYGPAVLTDPPYVRSREYHSDELSATRTAKPTLHPNRNLVKVDFDFVIKSTDGENIDRFSEEHWLRYLFLPEISAYLESSGFEMACALNWMTAEPPDTQSWYAVVVAKAV